MAISKGLFHSETVMLALVGKGITRETAYRYRAAERHGSMETGRRLQAAAEERSGYPEIPEQQGDRRLLRSFTYAEEGGLSFSRGSLRKKTMITAKTRICPEANAEVEFLVLVLRGEKDV